MADMLQVEWPSNTSAACPASLTPCRFTADTVICCSSSSTSCRDLQSSTIVPPDCFALPQAPDVASLAQLLASVSSTSTAATSTTNSASAPSRSTPATSAPFGSTATRTSAAPSISTSTTLTATTTTPTTLRKTTTHTHTSTLLSTTTTPAPATATALPDAAGTIHPRTVLGASLGTGLGVLLAIGLAVFFVLYRKDKKRKLRQLEKTVDVGGAGRGRRSTIISWPPQLPGFWFTGSGRLGVDGVGRESPASLEGVMEGAKVAKEGVGDGPGTGEGPGGEKDTAVAEVRSIRDDRVKSKDIGLAV